MKRLQLPLALLGAVALMLVGGGQTAHAASTSQWRLEQPEPPAPPPGVEPPPAKVGLGRIGDLEFWAPNRGLLITAGNPPTIPPGVWSYDGVSWRELSTVCGATDGRIAWAAKDEFWTISDGRPGQVAEHPVPLADNTLCHFKEGRVVGSYGSLAFKPDSYQAMHGAGCLSVTDCWFAGDPLPEGQVGAFHLHWDGGSIGAVSSPQGHGVQDMIALPPASRSGVPRYVYESVQIAQGDKLSEEESPSAPSLLHLITPIGVQPTFLPLTPGVPMYGEKEKPTALGFLRLGADERALWGAADPASAAQLEGAEVTIVRYSKEGIWSQLLGPSTDPSGGNPFTKFSHPERPAEENANEEVTSIAPDPESESAWLALTSPENARLGSAAPAMVARVSSGGAISERQTLPTPAETEQGIGSKGAASKIACPAPGDCWLATTRGWLFHLSGGTALERDTDPVFSGLITVRPPDAGVPQVQPDAPPVDDSGLLGEPPPPAGSLSENPAATQTTVAVALLSQIRTRLLHGTTLELRFRLAVRARVRLLARRRRRVVASTPMRTFDAGTQKLTLRLNLHSWPTKLDLETHALAPLPTVSTRGAGTTSVGTGLRVLPHTPPFSGSGSLP
jgi:hypothetical protein